MRRKAASADFRRSSLAAMVMTREPSRAAVLDHIYGGESVCAARRLFADVQDLAMGGLRAHLTERGTYEAATRPRVPKAVCQALVEAAAETGSHYAYARPLKLALAKLVDEPVAAVGSGTPRAMLCRDAGVHALHAAENALSEGYAVQLRDDSGMRMFSPQGIVVGGGRVQIVGKLGSEWVCMCADELRLRSSKIKRERFEFLPVPRGVRQLPVIPTHVGKFASRSLGAECLSYSWTVGSLIARGEVGTVEEVIARAGGDAEAVKSAVAVVNCTNVENEYLGYIEVGDEGSIAFDEEVLTDALVRGWPLTPLELRASAGALLLAGRSEEAEALELAVGAEARVWLAEGAVTKTGQLELCAAA